jgi:hypothetical protein
LIPPLVDTAAGDDVLVGVAGQQAELEWRVVGAGSCCPLSKASSKNQPKHGNMP